ncbi:MAG: hypothetical protein IKJ19_07600 [Clostridia bacterium]|nr:hypothetical protein [Clostridia bacterium]
MKKGSLFAKIVYYLFAFSLGIMLAVFLPFVYMYDGEALNTIQQSLDAGNYSQAMGMVGGYYNEQYVLYKSFERGGSVVIFESATLYEHKYGDDTSAENVVKKYKMHKSYAGFVFGLDDKFAVSSIAENKTKLFINTTDGAKEFELLNCDTNNDQVFDNISSLLTNNFFFLEFSDSDMQSLGITNILSLTFIMADGSEYGTIETTNPTFSSENLFKTQFFNDVEAFIEKNNEVADYTVLHAEDEDFDQKNQALGAELNALDAQLLSNENYAKSNTSIARSSADKRATRTIIIYFVCVYVLGDFLLGTRYILRFIKWFGTKVLKIKSKEPKIDESTFGTDYYSQVEITLHNEGVSESEEIKLTYANETESVTFTFNYVNGYKDKQRMKAGVYNLQPSELETTYETKSIPATIIAEGYRKAVEAKIIKR